MLLSNIYKNVGGLRVRQFGRIAGIQKNRIEKNSKSILHEKKLLQTVTAKNYLCKKYYSNETDDEQNERKVKLPPLTNDTVIEVPNIFKALISSYYLHAVLKARLDKDFSMLDFVEGSKHAVEVVSHALARKDYDSLDGLVANAVLVKLKNKISTLTPAQRELIPVKKSDIYGCFPHTISIIYEGENDRQRVFAEITMVYHSLRDFESLVNQEDKPLLKISLAAQHQDKMHLSNYRFRRDYTDNTNEPWIITMCNEMMTLDAH